MIIQEAARYWFYNYNKYSYIEIINKQGTDYFGYSTYTTASFRILNHISFASIHYHSAKKMYNLDHIKNTTLIVGGQRSSSPYNVSIYDYITGIVNKELSGGHTTNI